MNAKAVFLIVSGLLSAAMLVPAAADAQSSREDGGFQRLTEYFYADPQPRSLSSALKFFVNQFGRPQSLEADAGQIRLAAYARFFAILGDRHPELWRHAEQLFEQGTWADRRVLLEIFNRNLDDSLKASLRRWAAEEDDPDRRILLERCLYFRTPVLAFLEHLPGNQMQLEEQWAAFFATGDLRVVQHTLTLLAKPVDGKTPALLDQRLRETALQVLLQRTRVHPPLKAAIAKALASSESEALLPLRQALACQALQAGIFADFDGWLPSAWIARMVPEDRLFYETCAEVLQSRSQAPPGKIEALAAVNRVQAEWLRAHHAYLRWRTAREAAGRLQPLSDQGRDLLLKLKDRLVQTEETAVYSLWQLETDPPEPRAEAFFHLQAAMGSGPERRWLVLVKLLPTESQAQIGDRMFRWTDRHPQWIPVDSGFLDARIRQAVRTDNLAEWLEQQTPRSIGKLFYAGEPPLIRVTYGSVPGANLWNDSLEFLFPGQSHEVDRLTLDFEPSALKPVRIQADVVVYAEGQTRAAGSVTHIFYEPGNDPLAWLEGLR